jgi:hypothetical protein
VEEHLSGGEIERYRSRIASAHEVRAVLVHIDACEDCREQVSRPDDLDDLSGALGDFFAEPDGFVVEHLTAEIMAAYLGGDLSDGARKLAERHIESCDVCQGEVFELRALLPLVMEDAFAGKPEARDRPTAAVSATPSRWRGYGALLGRAAGWAAIVVLCASVLVLRRQVAVLQASLSRLSGIESAVESQRDLIAKLSAEVETVHAGEGGSLPAVAEPVITLRDSGAVVTLDKEGVVAGLAGLPASYERLIKEALIRQRIEIPASVKGLAGEREILMSGGDKASPFSLVSPIATIVKSRTPTFRWRPLAGATGYTVTVTDSQSRHVATSATLTKTNWAVPEALERGKTYYWQVAAIREGHEIISPAPSAQRAKFEILDSKKFAEVTSAEAAYKDSHLLLGALYAQAGLLDDARREILALQRANPNSPVARRLLTSIPR